MSHPLKRQLAMLRAWARWLLLVWGLGRALTAGIAGLLILALLDQTFRYRDPGLRLISSLAAAGWLLWLGHRYLARFLAARLDDVSLALRLERHFPRLRDRLASAVEFLSHPQEDLTVGSAQLRQATIQQVTAQVRWMDVRRVLDYRPALWAVFSLFIAMFLATIAIAVYPVSARIALARMVNPFGDSVWPQVTHLELRRRVETVARGQPFEVEVIDRLGVRLPADVRITYRFEEPDSPASVETELMRPLADAMFARRENITRPFAYRVEGGDDRSMPWINVQVVEPPRIVELRARSIPPEYTGWPVIESLVVQETLGAAAATPGSESRPDAGHPRGTTVLAGYGGPLRALSGSRLDFEARANKPLTSAVLCFDDGRRITGQLTDPQRIRVPPAGEQFVLDKSGSYWLELIDRDAISSTPGDRWEIRAVADQPPRVSLEMPAKELFVTPTAVLPLRVSVQDDLAIAAIDLNYQHSDRQQVDATTPLYEGLPRAEPVQKPSGGDFPSGESRQVSYRWDLAPLKLDPGKTVSFFVSARDYGMGVGRSGVQVLQVITAEEFQVRLAGRQGMILTELTRSLKLQQDNQAQLDARSDRLADRGCLEQLDLDHLQSAALHQRQVERILSGPVDGLSQLVRGLLADMDNNRLDAPDLRRRMEGLLAAIDRLQHQQLAKIARELTAAVKSTQIALQEQTGGAWHDAADRLQEARLQQQSLIAELKKLTAQWRQWDDYRHFHRQVGELLSDQEQVAVHTAELAQQTLTRELKDLRPQQAAELRAMASQQLDLALRTDQLQEQMRQTAARLTPTDPLSADILSDATEQIQQRGLSGQMRAVRTYLERNQMGQALQTHRQITQGLREVLGLLAGGQEQELSRLARRLAESLEELDALLRAQSDVAERIGRAANAQDYRDELRKLVDLQRSLGEVATSAARRIERLAAPLAARNTQDAAGAMERSAQAAGEGQASESGRMAGEALASLRRARTELQRQRAEALAELASENTSRLQQEATILRQQQEELLSETIQFDSSQGRSSLQRQSALESLARRQRVVQADTAQLAQRETSLAFRLTLSQAAVDMNQAAELLQRQQTSSATQQMQSSAVRRLTLLLAALTDKQTSPRPPPSGQQQEPPKQSAPRAQAAQWRLLRLLQQDLYQRTRQLSESTEPDQTRRLKAARLSEEQGQLVRLVLQSLRSQQGVQP